MPFFRFTKCLATNASPSAAYSSAVRYGREEGPDVDAAPQPSRAAPETLSSVAAVGACSAVLAAK